MNISSHTCSKFFSLIVFVCLFPTALRAADAGSVAPVKEKKVRNDHGFKNNDGEAYNKRHGVLLLLGPGSPQGGGGGPLGLPPSLIDIQGTYVHPTGLEASVSVVPGITAGVRYRAGPLLYGSAGAAIAFSVLGLGPGVYTAVGMSVMRHWPVTIEFEAKQTMAVTFSGGSALLTLPFALRMGAGYYF